MEVKFILIIITYLIFKFLMVKKVVKDSTVFSPKKDLISGKPSVEPSHNDENVSHTLTIEFEPE